MEAVLQSLKDMEVKNPPAKEEPSAPSIINIGQPEPSQKEVKEEGSLAATKPAIPETANHHDSAAPQDLLPRPSKSSAETTHKESGKDVSASNQSSTTTISDAVDQTKATVTVEKSPTSNIMDGLLRRWDLNFFRNRWLFSQKGKVGWMHVLYEMKERKMLAEDTKEFPKIALIRRNCRYIYKYIQIYLFFFQELNWIVNHYHK